MDGSDLEIIFRLSKRNRLSTDTYPLYKNEDGYFSPETGWEDDVPQVSENCKYCFMVRRLKKDGVWSEWSKPKLWTKFK